MACSENDIQSLIKFLESEDRKYSTKLIEFQAMKNNVLIKYNKVLENKNKTFYEFRNVTENQYKNESGNKWVSLVRMLEEVIQNQKDFEILNRKYDITQKDLEEYKIKFIQQTSQRCDYYVKLARNVIFSCKDERDKWIHNKIQKIDNKIRYSKNMLDYMKQYGEEVKSRLIEQHHKIINFIRQKEHARANVSTLNNIKQKFVKLIDTHQTSRNDISLKEKICINNRLALNNKLLDITRAIDAKKGNDILTGEKFMKKLITLSNENYYLGLLIENFSCDKEFYDAIDVIFGKKLYNHIISNVYWAKKIERQVKILNLGKAITILSVDSLPSIEYTYPDDKAIIPFITKLKYDDKLDKLMKFIFGKILICDDLDVAIKYSTNKEYICITSDGKHVLPNETRHERNLSGITLYTAKMQITELLLACNNEMNDLKKQSVGLELNIVETFNGVKIFGYKSFQNLQYLEKASSNLVKSQETYKNLLSLFERNEICMNNTNSILSNLNINKCKLQSELSKNMMSSNLDKKEVKSIHLNVVKLKNQLKARLDRLEKLEKEKSEKINSIEKLSSKYNAIKHAIALNPILTKDIILEKYCNQIDDIDMKISKFHLQITLFDQHIKNLYEKLADIKRDLKMFEEDYNKQ